MTRADKIIEIMALEIGKSTGCAADVAVQTARSVAAKIESSGFKVAGREPTEEMVAAGDDGYYGMSGTETWHAMWDLVPTIAAGMKKETDS